MSYRHPILIPGAPGHDDPEALREAIERLTTPLSLLDIRVELATARDRAADIETIVGKYGRVRFIAEFEGESARDYEDAVRENLEALQLIIEQLRTQIGELA